MKTSVFKIWLLSNKKIVREIEVPENISLYKFAEAIVKVFNFNFDHAFGFFSDITQGDYGNSKEQYELFADLGEQDIEPTGAESVKKTKISQVWNQPGDKMMFLFDYGDDWRFVVEFLSFGEYSKKVEYPKIVKKIGQAPKQY